MSAPATPFRSGPTEVDRHSVEDLVSRLPEARESDRGFDYPWQIRAFALAVAAHQAHQYQWGEFQAALIESIRAWEKRFGVGDPSWSYYEHWVNALEAVLTRSATVDPGALGERTRDVLCTPPNRDHQAAHRDPVAIDPARVAVDVVGGSVE